MERCKQTLKQQGPMAPGRVIHLEKKMNYFLNFISNFLSILSRKNNANTRGEFPLNKWNYLLQGRPLVVHVPGGGVVRGCVRLQWIFLKTLSTCLPITWWVIYERTCPHCAECSAAFDQKKASRFAPASLFTWSRPEWFFFCCFSGWKKSSEGNIWLMWQRRNKRAEALKGVKIDKFKDCFEQWKNVSIGV